MKNKNSLFTKKGLSPLISSILLIVVAVVLVTLILTWGKESTTSNLEKTDDFGDLKTSDASYFIYLKEFSNGLLQFNYSPPNNLPKDIKIIKYKILYDGNETDEKEIENVYIKPGSNFLKLDDFNDFNIPSEKITIILETDDHKFITLLDITNPYLYEPAIPSSENFILGFSILNVDITEITIDNDLNTINLEVSHGTDVTSLTPEITVSEGATIAPASGVSKDFTNPVTYTVTAEDRSTREYDVTIGIEVIPCSIVPENSVIYFLEHLAYIDTNVQTRAGTYTLARDLDFLEDSSYCEPENYKVSWTTGNGWKPIGNYSTAFTGVFDGQSYTISNLYINRSSNNGLFGYGVNATFKNVILKNIDITTIGFMDAAGGVIGTASATIENCHVSGSISNAFYSGGISGTLNGDIKNSSSSVNIMPNLVYNVGYQAGGLIGWFSNGTIETSYATGAVSGTDFVGGLVGYADGTITSSYSTGSVSGTGNDVGGLVGGNYGTIQNSYWDTETSGQPTSAGGTGKTTAQMKTKSTFIGWDFDGIWNIDEGITYPYLRGHIYGYKNPKPT